MANSTGGEGHMSFSFARLLEVSGWLARSQPLEDLVARADAALYEERGRLSS